MFQRMLNTETTRSFFLFGARGTGKTTLLLERFSQNETFFVDLLNPSIERRLSKKPELLKAMVRGQTGKTVIIDEIQKVPALLDVVHGILTEKKTRFILTGSSARKLKRGAANLLAGRASVKELFPLTYIELGDAFSLEEALNWGTLPEIASLTISEDKQGFLAAYAQTYLREEIASEQLVRKVEAFRGFLEVAAQMNGKLINASKIGNDVGVDVKTVQTYFSILEDTHIGFMLEQYNKSARKRVMVAPKFYFFDIGVVRALAQTVYYPLAPGTSYYGDCFEHFLVCELYRLVSYANRGQRLFILTSQDGFEIDLIVETPGMPLTVCEIKSAEVVENRHAKSLRLSKKDFPADTRFVLLSQDPLDRIEDGVQYVYWRRFLEREIIRHPRPPGMKQSI